MRRRPTGANARRIAKRSQPRAPNRIGPLAPVVARRPASRSHRRLDHAPYHRPVEHDLLDLLDGAAARYGDRPALGLRGDDESTASWTYRELARRSRIAAWRLRALGLEPGDRILTWSPSTPELPAAYFGAMRAGVILVPLDLRMAPDAIERIAARAEAKRLLIGTGRDAPDPARGRPGLLPDDPPRRARRRAGRLASRRTGRPRSTPGRSPARDTIFELVFTSGTTGTPKGVMLAHDNVLATVAAIASRHPAARAPRRLAAAALAPVRAGRRAHLRADVGADILYVRSRNPRVIFEAIRGHRTTSMIVVPQILDLFWSAIEREVEKTGRTAAFDRLRRIARHLPYAARRVLFRRVHAQLGGGLRIFVSSGAFLPPALQQAWEDLGVIVIQGYGSDRDRLRDVHDARGPRPRDGRPADAAGRDAARRRRRDPVPRPDALQGLLARPRRHGRARSPTTAGTGPATSAGSTRRATSCSWAGRRTSSSCRTA